jgi:hypothetical protein
LRGAWRLKVRVASCGTVVGIAHDTKLRVVVEHIGPTLHVLDDLGLDLCVGVAVVGQAKKGVCKGTAGEFAMHVLSAVLGERMRKLKGVELDVGIAVRETSNDTLDSLLGAILVVAYFVADLDNGTPIFGGEVLIGSLDYAGVSRMNRHKGTSAD